MLLIGYQVAIHAGQEYMFAMSTYYFFGKSAYLLSQA